MATPRAFTLPELLLALLVAGVAAALSVRPALRQADALVLRGAREELVSLFHRARAEARLIGDMRLRVAEGEDPVLSFPDGRPALRLAFGRRGVDIEVAGDRTEVELLFGPLGIATFGAATLRMTKRSAALPLTISSYGRVRR
jgi:prepilin-type N-terminal cleavage/methylation domain-containing protein